METASNNTTNQKIRDFTVSIMRAHSPQGERAAKITWPHHAPMFVPVQILPLAAGKDAWMREIKVKCSCCRQAFPAGEMQGGYADIACQTCIEKAEEEIAQENA